MGRPKGSRNKEGRIFLICGTCGIIFEPNYYQKYNIKIRPTHQIFCSKDCYYKRTVAEATKIKSSLSHKGKKLTEEHRIKISVANNGKKQAPEHIAKNLASRKKKYDLLGRKTDERKLGRHRVEYKNWRMDVFTRDSFKCKKCGTTNKILRAHHIENWLQHENKRLDINNGITLCDDCHKMFHKLFGRINNNLKQLNEYIRSLYISA